MYENIQRKPTLFFNYLQVVYDNYYLYVFAPDNDCRLKWVRALKEGEQLFKTLLWHFLYRLCAFYLNKMVHYQILILYKETKGNNLASNYHPDFWGEGRWRCCNRTDKLAPGCSDYYPSGGGTVKDSCYENIIILFSYKAILMWNVIFSKWVLLLHSFQKTSAPNTRPWGKSNVILLLRYIYCGNQMEFFAHF